MDKIVVKQHIDNNKRLLLGICDKSILGKKFEEKEVVLDASSDFFNGEVVSSKEAQELIRKAYSIFAAGKLSVNLLIEMGLATEANIITVRKIPYVNVLQIFNN